MQLARRKSAITRRIKAIFSDAHLANDKRWIGMQANTRTLCSCHMCRAHYKPKEPRHVVNPKQELLHEQESVSLTSRRHRVLPE